jgi:uncharacterized protein (TIGR03084 family)
MNVFDDLEAEEDRLEAVLDALDDDAWRSPSAAPGWSVTDVVLHLAQSEEVVVASTGSAATALRDASLPAPLDEVMEDRVRAERAEPSVVFERWRIARRNALDVLRGADPGRRIAWATNPLTPGTLATTRLAEHWAHALDVVEPLAIPYDDTPRLRHIAWLGHRTLPYAFGLAGLAPVNVRCQLIGPDGERWDYGPVDAAARITGSAGSFCRVGARRLAPERSGLVADGPGAAEALALLRNYAV